jgi:hypothetical protein
MTGPLVDVESAQELMREALGKISSWELDTIEEECRAKHRGVRALLGPERSMPLGEDELRRLLRSVFATRRRVEELFRSVGPARLADEIGRLVGGTEPLPARFQAFVDALAPVSPRVASDLAAECLRYTAPDRHWLWTRWIWDRETRTGALPLVTTEGYDLDGGTAGGTYVRVGEALAAVQRTGEAAGFTRIGQGRFGLDAFLACVYGVYVYTAVRLRITQEFNRVIPPLPELCRRLLGVHRMEV